MDSHANGHGLVPQNIYRNEKKKLDVTILPRGKKISGVIEHREKLKGRGHDFRAIFCK